MTTWKEASLLNFYSWRKILKVWTIIYSSLVISCLIDDFKQDSVQFSCSVMFDSLQPHGSHHARPPCPSPTPGIYSNSCPLSLWCHPAISSSVVPFSSCPQSLPASGSFPMSQLLKWIKSSLLLEFYIIYNNFIHFSYAYTLKIVQNIHILTKVISQVFYIFQHIL